MKARVAPKLIDKLKKQNVLIRKSFKEAINLFSKDPHNPELNNHELQREWEGFRSINVTADWRAIYKEIQYEEESVAYFVAIGTHDQLFKQKSS